MLISSGNIKPKCNFWAFFVGRFGLTISCLRWSFLSLVMWVRKCVHKKKTLADSHVFSWICQEYSAQRHKKQIPKRNSSTVHSSHRYFVTRCFCQLAAFVSSRCTNVKFSGRCSVNFSGLMCWAWMKCVWVVECLHHLKMSKRMMLK